MFGLSCNDSWANEPVQRIYWEMMHGSPPILSRSEKEILQRRIHKEANLLQNQFRNTSPGHLRFCDRYSRVLRELVKQIDRPIQSLGTFKKIDQMTDEDLLTSTRLRLLIPGLFGLHALFINESEAGYGTIDRHIHSSCHFENRDAINENFDLLVRDLSRFNRDVLGNPGLFGLERITDRLLKVATQQEDFRNEVSWGVLALATVTSLVFWEFAPAAVATMAERLFIVVPAAVQPGLVFGTRGLALAGEGLGYHYVDRAILPPQSEYQKVILASWDEQMKELEDLLRTPIASPQIYITYLGQIKIQVASLYEPWLRAHLGQINQQLGLQPIGRLR